MLVNYSPNKAIKLPRVNVNIEEVSEVFLTIYHLKTEIAKIPTEVYDTLGNSFYFYISHDEISPYLAMNIVVTVVEGDVHKKFDIQLDIAEGPKASNVYLNEGFTSKNTCGCLPLRYVREPNAPFVTGGGFSNNIDVLVSEANKLIPPGEEYTNPYMGKNHCALIYRLNDPVPSTSLSKNTLVYNVPNSNFPMPSAVNIPESSSAGGTYFDKRLATVAQRITFGRPQLNNDPESGSWEYGINSRNINGGNFLTIYSNMGSATKWSLGFWVRSDVRLIPDVPIAYISFGSNTLRLKATELSHSYTPAEEHEFKIKYPEISPAENHFILITINRLTSVIQVIINGNVYEAPYFVGSASGILNSYSCGIGGSCYFSDVFMLDHIPEIETLRKFHQATVLSPEEAANIQYRDRAFPYKVLPITPSLTLTRIPTTLMWGEYLLRVREYSSSGSPYIKYNYITDAFEDFDIDDGLWQEYVQPRVVTTGVTPSVNVQITHRNGRTQTFQLKTPTNQFPFALVNVMSVQRVRNNVDWWSYYRGRLYFVGMITEIVNSSTMETRTFPGLFWIGTELLFEGDVAMDKYRYEIPEESIGKPIISLKKGWCYFLRNSPIYPDDIGKIYDHLGNFIFQLPLHLFTNSSWTSSQAFQTKCLRFMDTFLWIISEFSTVTPPILESRTKLYSYTLGDTTAKEMYLPKYSQAFYTSTTGEEDYPMDLEIVGDKLYFAMRNYSDGYWQSGISNQFAFHSIDLSIVEDFLNP